MNTVEIKKEVVAALKAMEKADISSKGLVSKSKDSMQRVDSNKLNDMIALKLQELYKEYKLEDDEETKFGKVEKIAMTLTKESKEKLIKELQESLVA